MTSNLDSGVGDYTVGDYTPEIARACADRGAIWLDSVCPTWADEIDPDILDMESDYACVLGQAGMCVIESIQRTRPSLPTWLSAGWEDASYSTTLSYLRHVGVVNQSQLEEEWSAEFGFYIREPFMPGNMDRDADGAIVRECKVRWEMLQCAWLEEIAKRRATTATTEEIPTA